MKRDVRQTQAQLQATLSEAACSESHLQQSRQELRTEEERLGKLRDKVRRSFIMRGPGAYWSLFSLVTNVQVKFKWIHSLAECAHANRESRLRTGESQSRA